MKMVLLGLVLAGSLLLGGCLNENEFSRYPSVTIPHFEQADYLKQLSDRNPEIVYNATVQLGPAADDMAKKLSDATADRQSPEYVMAGQALTAVLANLHSREAGVVAASLRFLQLFSADYLDRAKLLEPVLQVHSHDYLVQYEQVMVIGELMGAGVKVPASAVRGFLDSPSWIVSRNAYLLVSHLPDGPLQQELIGRFQSTADEKEKLLLLTAFSTNASEQVAGVLLAELVTSKSLAVKQTICDVLQQAHNPDQVLRALERDSDKLGGEVQQYIVASRLPSLGNLFSSELVCHFLKHGYPADAEFLKALNDQLEQYRSASTDADREALRNVQAVAAVVQKNPALAPPWEVLRAKTDWMNADVAQLQTKCDQLTADYTAKLDDLLDKNGIPSASRQAYLNQIRNNRDAFKTMIASKRPATQ
jgi:outer membrane murein-binding lipoprotein Lpp